MEYIAGTAEEVARFLALTGRDLSATPESLAELAAPVRERGEGVSSAVQALATRPALRNWLPTAAAPAQIASFIDQRGARNSRVDLVAGFVDRVLDQQVVVETEQGLAQRAYFFALEIGRSSQEPDGLGQYLRIKLPAIPKPVAYVYPAGGKVDVYGPVGLADGRHFVEIRRVNERDRYKVAVRLRDRDAIEEGIEVLRGALGMVLPGMITFVTDESEGGSRSAPANDSEAT